MPLFFLIPLFTGLITGYFFNQKNDEIGYIAGVFTAISVILCLILSPWQVQLGLLMLVLVGSNQLLRKIY
jgi:drug/metabolite transporter (DMT)-like permease